MVQNDHIFAARPWTSNEWSYGDDNVKQYIVNYSHWALLFLFRNSVPNSYLDNKQITAALLNAAEQPDYKALNQLVNLQLQEQRLSSHLGFDNAVKIAAKSGKVGLIDALLLDTKILEGRQLDDAIRYGV